MMNTTETEYPVTLPSGLELSVMIGTPHAYGVNAQTFFFADDTCEATRTRTYLDYCHADIVALEIERAAAGTRHALDATSVMDALGLECNCDDDEEAA